jgi:hypothetical protein
MGKVYPVFAMVGGIGAVLADALVAVLERA